MCMKWTRIVYSLISLLLLISCMKKEEPFFFEGLTLSEMQGEWIIFKRVKDDYPTNTQIALSVCDSQEVLIINSNGEAIHRIYSGVNEPCEYTDYTIKFIGSNNYTRGIEKIDLPNSREYLGCNIYSSKSQGGPVLDIKYFHSPDSLNKIHDLFRRK